MSGVYTREVWPGISSQPKLNPPPSPPATFSCVVVVVVSDYNVTRLTGTPTTPTGCRGARKQSNKRRTDRVCCCHCCFCYTPLRRVHVTTKQTIKLYQWRSTHTHTHTQSWYYKWPWSKLYCRLNITTRLVITHSAALILTYQNLKLAL